MLRQERRRVAYYYRVPDTSTFRYRCYSMVQAINEGVDGVSAAWFCEADGVRLLDVVREVETLVVVRAKYTAELAQLITVAKAAGTRVLFDCDDLVFDPAYVPHVLHALDLFDPEPAHSEAMWDHWFADFARTRAALLLCDGFVVTNRYLAERAAESVDLPVHVIANFMCAEQVEYSKYLLRLRDDAGTARDGFLDIGYFSGTPTHRKDFAIARGALGRLLDRHDHVRVRIAGYLDHVSEELLRHEDRVGTLPFTDFLNLQRLIAAVEVNIAPLQQQVFSNCKSDLKYFDAAAVGVPTIASPTFALSSAIEHGRNGLLADADEWDECLEAIVSDYDGLGRKLGAAAAEDAYLLHTAQAHVPSIRAALGL